jgi:hypothetical protein
MALGDRTPIAGQLAVRAVAGSECSRLQQKRSASLRVVRPLSGHRRWIRLLFTHQPASLGGWEVKLRVS